MNKILDTSFILLTLGISTGTKVERSLEKLNEMKAEIYYSSFSILESIWVALKLMRRSKLDHERFRLGLRSLIETDRYTRIVENTEAFTHALRLYILGHLDVIDNILYANSIQFNLKFLTTDEELRKFIRKRKLKDTTLTPDELLQDS